jgi:ABC-type Co2+ transport system permease subunit
VAIDTLMKDGIAALALRSAIAVALVFCFFEVFPHHPVGVSEVHLILGTTLLLVFGLAPAALGLAGGLLIQGLFFEPQDLPQYGMNVTTLLVPLFATSALARRIVPRNVAYVDIGYQQAFKLSVAYQGGIVVWVGFWALYGRGTGLENLGQIASFGVAYMTVVLVEPLVDLGVLAAAKGWRRLQGSAFVERRLYGGI